MGKAAVAGALVAVVLAAAALFAGARSLDWSARKPEIAAAVGALIGRDVEIRGPLALEPAWPLRLRAVDLRIAGGARAAAAELHVSPLALAMGDIAIEGVRLVEPALTLERGATPDMATAANALAALEIPSSGGHTRFCNTEKAYEDLPEATKKRLRGLNAVHSYDTARAPARAVARTEEEIADTPDVVHPLVRTHDETGKKALFFNANRTDRVVGLARAESDELLDSIHAHMTQPQYRYDHEWRVGDILLWDNRCLIHSVNVDYPVGEPRIHLRTLLKGDRPH